MTDAVPEPVFPEADAYPAYREPTPVVAQRPKRSAIDEYVLTAIIATNTVLVGQKRPRRITEA